MKMKEKFKKYLKFSWETKLLDNSSILKEKSKKGNLETIANLKKNMIPISQFRE